MNPYKFFNGIENTRLAMRTTVMAKPLKNEGFYDNSA